MAQLNQMKKKADSSVVVNKRIGAFSQQLSELEKQAGSLGPTNQWGLITSYNDIVKSLKKEMPTDAYIQNVTELNPEANWLTIGPALKTGSSQLQNYLERTYLK